MATFIARRGTGRVVASLLVCLAAAPASVPAQPPGRSPVPAVDDAGRSDQADAELVSALLMGVDDVARADAVRRLSDVAPDLALIALQQAILDARVDVRLAAIDALADIGGDGAVALLTAALVDSVGEVREDAVYALGRLGGALVEEALVVPLSDVDPAVRDAARLVSSELARRRAPRPIRPRRRR